MDDFLGIAGALIVILMPLGMAWWLLERGGDHRSAAIVIRGKMPR